MFLSNLTTSNNHPQLDLPFRYRSPLNRIELDLRDDLPQRSPPEETDKVPTDREEDESQVYV